MSKIIIIFFLLLASAVACAQGIGNPGGGGPGKGNEEFNYCHDLKITVEEHIQELFKLEKNQYDYEKDFFKYLDEQIVKIAFNQLNIYNHIKVLSTEKSKLLPCGQEEKKIEISEKNEKLELLKKILWTIKKSQNGHKTCNDLFNKYYHRQNQLEIIIQFYENQEK